MSKENKLKTDDDQFRVVYNNGEIKSEWTNEINAHKEFIIHSLIYGTQYDAKIESQANGFLIGAPKNSYSYCFTCNKRLSEELKTKSEAWKDCFFHKRIPLFYNHNAQPVDATHHS